MMTKCLFISASLYLAFKYRCCESKRRVNTKTIETCSVTIQYKFFGKQSANIRESPSNIPRPFVSFDIFQLIFVRETRIRSTQHSKRCTHNVYRAVTAANMLVEEEDEKTNWYLNQNIFHLGESGHDRAQQQQQLFFPPTLYLRKWDRNFFPTLFSSNFYFSSDHGDLGGPDWQWRGCISAVEIDWNQEKQQPDSVLNFVFLFLRKEIN